MTELQIALLTVGIVLAVNFIAVALHFLYKAMSNSPLRETIRNVIHALDKFADDMENVEKRRIAIQQVNDVLGWRKVFVPAALIGWIIDVEVKAIRKMQRASDTEEELL